MKGRVNFVEPVPTIDIVREISRYDLGVHLIPPLSRNNEFALPNKFFEFIQANLAIVIGPSVEMSRIVEDFSLGMVSKSFQISEVAKALNLLNRAQIETFRRNSNQASKNFCWERESQVLLTQVKTHLRQNYIRDNQ
jgi:hypothetical protein